MGSRWGLSARENFCERLRILPVLFVFLIETTGIFSAVARSAFMGQRGGLLGRCHNSLYLRFDPRAFSTG